MNIFQQVFAKVNPKASDLLDAGENVSPQTGRSEMIKSNRKALASKTEPSKTSSMRVERIPSKVVDENRAKSVRSVTLKSPTKGIPIRKNSPMKAEHTIIKQTKPTDESSRELERLAKENKRLLEQVEALKAENKKILHDSQVQLEEREAIWSLKMEELRLSIQ